MRKIRSLSVPSVLALALVSLTVSTIFDGGFFRGFFQGAAAALLALFVLMVFLQRRSARTPDRGTPDRGTPDRSADDPGAAR